MIFRTNRFKQRKYSLLRLNLSRALLNLFSSYYSSFIAACMYSSVHRIINEIPRTFLPTYYYAFYLLSGTYLVAIQLQCPLLGCRVGIDRAHLYLWAIENGEKWRAKDDPQKVKMCISFYNRPLFELNVLAIR